MVQAGKKINQPEFCEAGPNHGLPRPLLLQVQCMFYWQPGTIIRGLGVGEYEGKGKLRKVCSSGLLHVFFENASLFNRGAWGDSSRGPKNSSGDETTQKPRWQFTTAIINHLRWEPCQVPLNMSQNAKAFFWWPGTLSLNWLYKMFGAFGQSVKHCIKQKEFSLLCWPRVLIYPSNSKRRF